MCHIVTTGSAGNIKSTFGRKVWDWTIQNNADDLPEQKIIFHDHGGQEAVLPTFLPFLIDSDIVLIFFKKTDHATFTQACKILDQLQTITNNRAKFFLVQTYIDHDVNEINMNEIEHLKNTNRIIDCVNISPVTQMGLQNFKERIIKEIPWPDAKIMAQSKYVTWLTYTISSFEMENASVVNFNDIKKRYGDLVDHDIPNDHLQFLLKSFSNQGLIEYHAELNSIIFNDETYNQLRSNIPILAANNKGIVSMNDICNFFQNRTYVATIDRVFLKYGIAIQCGVLRIFPHYLKSEPVDVPELFKSLLQTPAFHSKLHFQHQTAELSTLIRDLTELHLECIDLSSKDGIFSWGTNACLYYSISETGNAVNGRLTEVSYFIGGEKETVCSRLDRDFRAILKHVLGPTSNLE